MRFFLGCHNPEWLNETSVPLFIQRGPLSGKSVHTIPRARGPWALDSGGFTEIKTWGRWTVTPEEYAREVRFWQREIGNLEWAAIQDWMCEPPMLLRAMVAEGHPLAKAFGLKDRGADTIKDVMALLDGVGVDTEIGQAIADDSDDEDKGKRKNRGRTFAKFRRDLQALEEEFRYRVCVHQQRTIDNFLELQRLAPEVPWAPVLQGWKTEDYLAHAEAYERAGVDLNKAPIVGLGSVCRRDKLDTAQAVITHLTGGKWKLRLHGFGLKISAFSDPIVSRSLSSSDSLAWSFGARRAARGRKGETPDGRRIAGKLPCGGGRGHPINKRTGKPHQSCSNCLKWAMMWRSDALEAWERTVSVSQENARRRRAANPPEARVTGRGGASWWKHRNPDEIPAELFDDLYSVISANVYPGKYIRSAGGKAEYMVTSVDRQRVVADRLSSGREIYVPTRRIIETAVRILSGEKIPVRGLSFTVTMEAIIVAALGPLVDLVRGRYQANQRTTQFSGLLPRIRREIAKLSRRASNPPADGLPPVLYAPANLRSTTAPLFVERTHAAQDDERGEVVEVATAELEPERLAPDSSGELDRVLEREPEHVVGPVDWVESLRIAGRCDYDLS